MENNTPSNAGTKQKIINVQGDEAAEKLGYVRLFLFAVAIVAKRKTIELHLCRKGHLARHARRATDRPAAPADFPASPARFDAGG